MFAAWPPDPTSNLFILSAPHGLLQPLRQTSQANSHSGVENFPVIWDTGASQSVSYHLSDFKKGIRPSATSSLTGLANGLSVMGEGEVTWTVSADDGRPFTLEHTAYYVPASPCRLLSCQTFSEYTYNLYGHAYEYVMRTYDPTHKFMRIQPSAEQAFLGRQLDLPTVTCMLDERTNLPISMASSATVPQPKAGAHLCVTDETNQIFRKPRRKF